MEATATAADRLLSTKEFAARVGVTEATARYWRWAGEGPRWMKLGKKIVKYRESDIAAWLDEAYAKD